MKITVLTLGSRGDVQPYVALATGLLAKGHEVTICTGHTFKSFVESHGINFKCASLDFMDLLKTEEGQAMFNGGGNIFKIMKFTKEVVNPGFRKSFDDFYEASQGSDIIIYHPKALVAPDLAEYFGIPCICMPPVPIVYPISEFPNLAISSQKNLGSFLNKLTYSVNKFGESASIKEINDFRNKTLGLSKRKMGAYTYDINGKETPIIYPISQQLFTEVESWKNRVSLTGFFYLPYEGSQLDSKIESFLDEGEEPIVISFSSMPLKNPENFRDLIVKALEATGSRAVILTGISGLSFEGYDHILSIEKAPHRLLFKRCKGIIHHGGVGTMAEALLSGRPQVIMPFNVDQPFWAHRLYKQKYALEPIVEKTVTVDDLINRLNSMNDAVVIDQAKKIASALAQEDGIARCVEIIESIVKES